MNESHKRSVIKSVSYRLIGSLATMLIVFAFTRKFALSLGVGIFELLAKIACFYIHERIWSRIKWGKLEHPLEDLNINKELSEEDKEKVKSQLKNMGYMD
ncbi:MAG: DUF2061 domain-containing protein [Candidatus Aureabacteria bacterium]|nr:DUF2061 domain-containing protein [Candidatus Auribacterota bacterium]